MIKTNLFGNLYEFSRDTKREKLKVRKTNVTAELLHGNGFVVMALLQWIRCSNFCLCCFPMFANKTTILLDDWLYRKILD